MIAIIAINLDQALVIRSVLKNIGRCDEEVQETIQLMSEVTQAEVDDAYNALEKQIRACISFPKPNVPAKQNQAKVKPQAKTTAKKK
jgi:hypothetical protein